MNLLADRKAVDSTPKYYLLAGDENQASIFFPCIRYKWVNSIDWSSKLFLTRQGLIQKTPVFHLFHHGKNWKVQSRATFKIPKSLCKLGKIMHSLTPTLKNVGKTDGIYIKYGWPHLKFKHNELFHFLNYIIYSTSSIFKNLSLNWEKYLFHLDVFLMAMLSCILNICKCSKNSCNQTFAFPGFGT